MAHIRKKTTFGKYLVEEGIKQSWLAEKAGVSEGLISQLANDKNRQPTYETMKLIVRVLKKKDRRIKGEQFWPIE